METPKIASNGIILLAWTDVIVEHPVHAKAVLPTLATPVCRDKFSSIETQFELEGKGIQPSPPISYLLLFAGNFNADFDGGEPNGVPRSAFLLEAIKMVVRTLLPAI